MATRAIKPKRDDTVLTGWTSIPEQAPSVMRQDQPTVARILAMKGVLFIAIGALAMLAPIFNWRYVVSPGWGYFLFTIGLLEVLYHALVDSDVQFRRIYLFLGLGLILMGAVSGIIALAGMTDRLFLPVGVPGLLLGLLLTLAAVRHETDPAPRSFALLAISVFGWAFIAVAVAVGMFNQEFLLREGILLLILGLLYACAAIGLMDIGSEGAFRMGLALGIAGGLVAAAALLRSFWPGSEFFIPSGLVFVTFGVIYLAIALGICSDWPLIVMTRREIAAIFYSPIGYLVLFGMMVVGWLMFWVFAEQMRQQGAMEPIVRQYIFDLIPVIAQMFIIPVLTMRLLSEEQRTGSLEVLLTAPINESTVVLSKFFAVLIFYLLTWLGTWLFMVALRVGGGQEFDYRPILSFMFAATATGSGFLAMGLFFSSITRNQIIAAVLTMVGMIFYLAVYFVKFQVGPFWSDILLYISYIDLWFQALEGIVAPRYFLYHLSAAVFFLYLSVKVLEARKWR